MNYQENEPYDLDITINMAFNGDEHSIRLLSQLINHISKTRPYQQQFELSDEITVDLLDDNYNKLDYFKITKGDMTINLRRT